MKPIPERITLNFPIEHDGLPIQEIALRRPTVGDHLASVHLALKERSRLRFQPQWSAQPASRSAASRSTRSIRWSSR